MKFKVHKKAVMIKRKKNNNNNNITVIQNRFVDARLRIEKAKKNKKNGNFEIKFTPYKQ